MGITDSFPRSWQCERCTYINDAWTGTCRICGTGKKSKPWICYKCGSSNPSGIILCNTCGSEQKTFGSKNSRKDWSCSLCSYTNFPDSSQCAICGFAKPEGNSSSFSDNGKSDVRVQVDSTRLGHKEVEADLLKCHKCQTLLYDNTGSHCTVCGTPCLSEGFKPRPFPQSSLPKGGAAELSSASGTWKCSQCTLLNDSTQTTCKACAYESVGKKKPVGKLMKIGKFFTYL